MADLYQHTDEDGARLTVCSRAEGDLLVAVTDGRFRVSGVDVPAVDGRRLLAALERYYAVVDAPDSGVIHRCPVDGYGIMPCCGRTPFEVPRTDRFAATDMFVNCKPPSRPEPSRGGTVATQPDVAAEDATHRDFKELAGIVRPRMADGCGGEHTCRGACEHAERPEGGAR